MLLRRQSQPGDQWREEINTLQYYNFESLFIFNLNIVSKWCPISLHSKINSLLTSCLTCSFPPSLASCICPFYSLSILFWGKVFCAHYHDYYFSPCRPLLTGKGLLVIGGSLQWLYARNFIQPIRGEPFKWERQNLQTSQANRRRRIATECEVKR